MKKRIILGCLFVALCFGLAGCKSSDYNDAVKFQEAGEYASAATLYAGLGDYKDAVSRQKDCENRIKDALVNAPSEAYIIECLAKVRSVVDVFAATETNDPNGQLNKPGGYIAQVYFSSDLINQSSVPGNTVIEKGTACGGSIEVYKTVEDAEKRNTYLSSFDGGNGSSGSHTVIGTVLIRTSNKLTATQQKELETNIIAALTSLKN